MTVPLSLCAARTLETSDAVTGNVLIANPPMLAAEPPPPPPSIPPQQAPGPAPAPGQLPQQNPNGTYGPNRG